MHLGFCLPIKLLLQFTEWYWISGCFKGECGPLAHGRIANEIKRLTLALNGLTSLAVRQQWSKLCLSVPLRIWVWPLYPGVVSQQSGLWYRVNYLSWLWRKASGLHATASAPKRINYLKESGFSKYSDWVCESPIFLQSSVQKILGKCLTSKLKHSLRHLSFNSGFIPNS